MCLSMTVGSPTKPLLPNAEGPGQADRGDISVEVLKKARATRDREANAIVDRLPGAKPGSGEVKRVDAYA